MEIIRIYYNDAACRFDHYRGAHPYLDTDTPSLHVHNYDEILLVHEGTFTNYIGTESLRCKGPHIIFNREGQPHITTGPPNSVY